MMAFFWILVPGHWWLVNCHWLLFSGTRHWLLAASSLRLVGTVADPTQM
jgi:hypothetical protein